MPATPTRPAYAPTELKALMDDTGTWAESWDDVLRHLRDSGASASDAAVELVRDVETLQRDDVRFTRDYRKIWQRLTGEDAAHLPPPRRLDPYALDPLEMQDDYLHELAFPCERKEIVRTARLNNAPGRVMERLEALPDRTYADRNALLEELDDASWDTAQ